MRDIGLLYRLKYGKRRAPTRNKTPVPIITHADDARIRQERSQARQKRESAERQARRELETIVKDEYESYSRLTEDD